MEDVRTLWKGDNGGTEVLIHQCRFLHPNIYIVIKNATAILYQIMRNCSVVERDEIPHWVNDTTILFSILHLQWVIYLALTIINVATIALSHMMFLNSKYKLPTFSLFDDNGWSSSSKISMSLSGREAGFGYWSPFPSAQGRLNTIHVLSSNNSVKGRLKFCL